ncbi:hypothetical protein TNCV_4420181 [Trichonephila clavipes]|nr:hypothetical protein TNCV_4420181 [Trichonephila clavipes]
MATGSYMTPIYSRSQSEVQGDLHKPTGQGNGLVVTSYTRAFGDGPRNFEPWSSDVNEPELAPLSPNYHTTPTGGRFSSRQIYLASLPYTAGL